MYVHADIHTPFHIDFGWWERNGRNLRPFLAEILGVEELDVGADGPPIDYVDPYTAEVHQLDPVWAQVLIERAHRPDYITSSTPLTNALLRALLENVNRPMSAVELHRRINRTSPATLLRLMRTAREQYGIVPANNNAAPPKK